MSIAQCDAKMAKVCRTLICFLFFSYPNRAPLTVGRGPVPRHASVLTETVRGLWAADVSRSVLGIAGDRPPRYGSSSVFSRNNLDKKHDIC